MLPTKRLVAGFAALVCMHAISDLPTVAGNSCPVGREEDDSGLLQVAHEVRPSETVELPPPQMCRQEGHDCDDHGRPECCRGFQCMPDHRGWKKTCVKPCLQAGATCGQSGGASGCCNGLECIKRPFAREGKCSPTPQCRQEGHDCDDHGRPECCRGLQCMPDRRGWKKTCVKPCLQAGATCGQNGGEIGCCNGLECIKQPFTREGKCAHVPPCRQEGAMCEENVPNQCCGRLQCRKKPFSGHSTCVSSSPMPPSPWPKCNYGAHVECPGTPGKTCSGNQCCPAIPGSRGSFPCPSASANYDRCQSRSKVADCLP